MGQKKTTCAPKAAGLQIMADAALTELFGQDPERALAELEHRYGGYCFQIAYRILNCREDAEECVNDVLLQVWNTLQIRQPECLRAYLAAAAKNRAITYYRKAHAGKRGGTLLTLSLYNGALVWQQSMEENLCNKMLIRQCLDALLAQYSPENREIFLLRYGAMQSISTLAERFSLSESCVRSRLFRMRGQLQRDLSRCGMEFS